MQAFAQSIVKTVRHPLLVLDLRGRKANAAFRRTFAVAGAEIEGRLVHELGGGPWDIPRLREVLEGVARDSSGSFKGFEVRHDFPNVGVKHRHGGRSGAEGSPGPGAAFHFTLPTEEGA